MEENKSYAVVFTYSFDSDTAVYLFDTEKDALIFLRESFMEELRIDREENGWDTESYIDEDAGYAEIINHFYDRDDKTEFRLGRVYS